MMIFLSLHKNDNFIKMIKKILKLSFELVVNAFREIALFLLKVVFYALIRLNIIANFRLDQILEQNKNLFKIDLDVEDDSVQSEQPEDLNDVKRKYASRMLSIQEVFVEGLKGLSVLAKSEKLFHVVPNIEKLLSVNTQIQHFMEHLIMNENIDGYVSKLYKEYPEMIPYLTDYVNQINGLAESLSAENAAFMLKAPYQYIVSFVQALENILSDIPESELEKEIIEKTISELNALKDNMKIVPDEEFEF